MGTHFDPSGEKRKRIIVIFFSPQFLRKPFVCLRHLLVHSFAASNGFSLHFCWRVKEIKANKRTNERNPLIGSVVSLFRIGIRSDYHHCQKTNHRSITSKSTNNQTITPRRTIKYANNHSKAYKQAIIWFQKSGQTKGKEVNWEKRLLSDWFIDWINHSLESKDIHRFASFTTKKEKQALRSEEGNLKTKSQTKGQIGHPALRPRNKKKRAEPKQKKRTRELKKIILPDISWTHFCVIRTKEQKIILVFITNIISVSPRHPSASHLFPNHPVFIF